MYELLMCFVTAFLFFNINPKSPDQVNTSSKDIQNIYMYMINKLYVRIKLYISKHSMYVIVFTLITYNLNGENLEQRQESNLFYPKRK